MKLFILKVQYWQLRFEETVTFRLWLWTNKLGYKLFGRGSDDPLAQKYLKLVVQPLGRISGELMKEMLNVALMHRILKHNQAKES